MYRNKKTSRRRAEVYWAGMQAHEWTPGRTDALHVAFPYGVMDEPRIKQHWSITLLPCAKIEYGHMVEKPQNLLFRKAV